MEVAAAVLRGGPERAGSRRTQRRLADGAKEILWAEPSCDLPSIARRLHVSPWHLSRVFHHATGTTLSRYRLRVRAIAALDRPAVAGMDLATLATELGFADQAHLSRTLRAETGQPPGLLRTLLSRAGQGSVRSGP